MDNPQMDTLYDSFDKSLYRFSGSASPDQIQAMLQANTSLDNSGMVQMPPDAIGSGVNAAIYQTATGSFQSGKKTFSDTSEGFILGFDPVDGFRKFVIGNSSSYFSLVGSSATFGGNPSAGGATFQAVDTNGFQYLLSRPDTSLWLRNDGTMSKTILRVDDSGGGISRVTPQGYFNFPKYRHRSEFDEASNPWASTNIAKTYWTTTDSVSGTQEIVNSAADPHAHLDTTATANRTSAIKFVKQFNLANGVGFEGFTKPNFITNGLWFLGLWADDTHYVGFLFDTALSSTKIYFIWGSGGSLIGGGYNVVDTGVTTSTTTAKRYSIFFKGGLLGSPTLNVLIDGTALSNTLIDSISNPFSPSTGYRPFFLVTNKAAAQSNQLDIGYADVFGDRNI